MDNLSYNNDLAYGSIADWRISVESLCSFCDQKGAKNKCKRCNKVIYCNDQCHASDEQDHKAFCDYFVNENVILLSITPKTNAGSNHLIEDRTAEKELKDYEDKEFLVKFSAGDDGFGLDRSDEEMFGIKIGHLKKDLMDTLRIYDEFRFIYGDTKCQKMFDIVRHFGKLSGEKCYNKRIFLYARLNRGNKNELLVRTDQFLHEQGW